MQSAKDIYYTHPKVLNYINGLKLEEKRAFIAKIMDANKTGKPFTIKIDGKNLTFSRK